MVPEKSGAKADCHFTTDPVLPLKVSTLLLVPEQTAPLPAKVPPTLDMVVTVNDGVYTTASFAVNAPLLK